jgi:hypothetical protein
VFGWHPRNVLEERHSQSENVRHEKWIAPCCLGIVAALMAGTVNIGIGLRRCMVPHQFSGDGPNVESEPHELGRRLMIAPNDQWGAHQQADASKHKTSFALPQHEIHRAVKRKWNNNSQPEEAGLEDGVVNACVF